MSKRSHCGLLVVLMACTCMLSMAVKVVGSLGLLITPTLMWP